MRADADGARIVRSVLMKPESEAWVPELHARAEDLVQHLGSPGSVLLR